MYLQKTSNKWTNAKQQVYNGSRYQSGFEAEYAKELDLRVKAKDIKRWEKQVKIPLIVNGFLVCNYYIDFVVYHNDDTKEYVELKGAVFAVWALKWKLFEALYSELPDVKLTVIKQQTNWTMRDIKKRQKKLNH